MYSPLPITLSPVATWLFLEVRKSFSPRAGFCAKFPSSSWLLKHYQPPNHAQLVSAPLMSPSSMSHPLVHPSPSHKAALLPSRYTHTLGQSVLHWLGSAIGIPSCDVCGLHPSFGLSTHVCPVGQLLVSALPPQLRPFIWAQRPGLSPTRLVARFAGSAMQVRLVAHLDMPRLPQRIGAETVDFVAAVEFVKT